MPKIIQPLINEARDAVEKIENFPFRCKGFEVLFEWVDEITELIETIENVYDEVENGAGLIEAWENEGSTGEELYETFIETCSPELLFLENADQYVDDLTLKDFLENADNYIRKLINDLQKAMSIVAETAFHDYQTSDNFSD